MQKFLFSILLLSTGLLSAQITLEHSFSNEELTVYTSSTETYYVSVGGGGTWEPVNPPLNSIKIYNSDFTLYKEFFPQIPSGYDRMLVMRSVSSPNLQYIVSKNIFSLNDKLNIVVFFENSMVESMIRIYDEDGVIIKDFGGDYAVGLDIYVSEDQLQNNFYVFHDSEANVNKLRLVKRDATTEIYTLPSSTLSIDSAPVQKVLKVYPNPTQTNLNITNPKNGSNKLEVFNVNGQLVKSLNFDSNEETIMISVSELSKGTYIIKTGDFSAKFIKK